jgi:cysteine desulfurase
MRIYLDHNATTPVRSEVADAMDRALREVHGNPSSTHSEGSAAREALETARSQVALLLGTRPDRVLFTAGATEANNTALLGLLRGREPAPGHVVSTLVEHPSVEAALQVLESAGWRVTRLPVDSDGVVALTALADALCDDTALVSVLWANNETGVLQDLEAWSAIVREHGALLHVDATQGIGKLPIDLGSLSVDLLSLSAHKFNGPKGVGCLVVDPELGFEPILHGGPQEKGRRGGTENLAGIVGLGVACDLADKELDQRSRRYSMLRDRLWEGIRTRIDGVKRNGSTAALLPNTLNVEFEDTAGEVLLQALDLEGVAASAGAACHSGSIEPSHVLTAMGLTPESARGSLRLSVGFGNDEEQIDFVLDRLCELVPRVREAEGA